MGHKDNEVKHPLQWMPLSVGAKLTAINPCIDYKGEKALTVGREYGIHAKKENSVMVIDDNAFCHEFSIERVHLYFKYSPQTIQSQIKLSEPITVKEGLSTFVSNSDQS